MKDKVLDIINKIRTNKRIMYISIVSILILFCLVLNITFSAFTASTKKEAANIIVGNFTYTTTINNVSSSIIEGTSNDITIVDIGLTSNNTLATKYELLYDVCTDSACNNIINIPSGLTVEYSSKTIDAVRDEIDESDTKSIRLVINNTTNTTYYLKLKVNAGFAYNELDYVNQITNKYYENAPEGWNNPTSGSILEAIKNTSADMLDSQIATIPGQQISAGGLNHAYSMEVSGTISYASTREDILNENYTGSDDYSNLYSTLDGKYISYNSRIYYIVTAASSNATVVDVTDIDLTTEAEARLGSAEDDYGWSYYFRGAVENNYVVFNNMCWRIVRITGDGSIKLILQNERGTSCEVSDYNYNYARYDGTNTTSRFNETAGVYDTATGVGFMYGNPSATTYLEAQANTTDSTILTNLKSWYDRVFTTDDVKNMLADTIWCGDKSLNSGVGYGQTYSNYGAWKRIYNGGTAASNIAARNPSLICPDAGTDGMLSKYTAEDTTNGNGLLKTEDNGTTKYYKIGLLTADEAAFAGGVYGVKNNTYYLYNGHYYWLLSPCNFNATYVRAFVWRVNSTGYLGNDDVANGRGVRPAVSLKSTASVSGGDGTIDNPYIIG